jgi:hypothetical protein
LNRLLLLTLAVGVAACGATAAPVVPTERPTVTATLTETATRTPGFEALPSATPPPTGGAATSGPTPTPLFGPTVTLLSALPTPTRVFNPNAPRIEFFTASALAVSPGDPLTLFWSTRGASNAVIYRLDANGERNQLWNVAPDGNLTVQTRRRDRGRVQFVLSVGEGDLQAEQTLTIPLACPDTWFFQPAPDSCPTGPAEQTSLTEQPFERGRLIYIKSRNRVYALFNDGREPAWVSFENRYDPARDPESIENFVPPPGLVQPIRALGFVWRGNDLTRNRLGLGVQAEAVYDGFVQTATTADGGEDLYVSSSDKKVLQLLPGGRVWQLITPP